MTLTPAMEKALALHKPLKPLGVNAKAEERAAWREAAFIRASISDRTMAEKVMAFRRLYGLSRFDKPVPGPLSQLRSELHRGLHAEEFGEAMLWTDDFVKALVHQARDTAETLDPTVEGDFNLWTEEVDGRLDLIVTLLGELLEMGLRPRQIDMLFAEVHASNMTKTDDEGNPVYDENGKVLKGSNYVKADIAGLLRQFIAEAPHG